MIFLKCDFWINVDFCPSVRSSIILQKMRLFEWFSKQGVKESRHDDDAVCTCGKKKIVLFLPGSHPMQIGHKL